MKEKTEEKILEVESPTDTLNTMRLRQTIKVPNSQRISFNGTIQRLKDSSSRKFQLKRHDTYFTIKRMK